MLVGAEPIGPMIDHPVEAWCDGGMQMVYCQSVPSYGS